MISLCVCPTTCGWVTRLHAIFPMEALSSSVQKKKVEDNPLLRPSPHPVLFVSSISSLLFLLDLGQVDNFLTPPCHSTCPPPYTLDCYTHLFSNFYPLLASASLSFLFSPLSSCFSLFFFGKIIHSSPTLYLSAFS